MDLLERKARRIARLSELIREEISKMLAKGEIKDPRVKFVTVMAVKITQDIQNCFIYISTFGSEQDETSALEGLNRASGFIRSLLAKRLVLKRIPRLKFMSDKSLRETGKIDEILDKLKAETNLDIVNDKGFSEGD